MFAELTTMFESALSVEEAIVPIGFSLIASVIAYLMYQLFYGSSHIGAGVWSRWRAIGSGWKCSARKSVPLRGRT